MTCTMEKFFTFCNLAHSIAFPGRKLSANICCEGTILQIQPRIQDTQMWKYKPEHAKFQIYVS